MNGSVKLACADDTFRLLDHEHIVELVRMLGVDGVDLCLMESRSSLRGPRTPVPDAGGPGHWRD